MLGVLDNFTMTPFQEFSIAVNAYKRAFSLLFHRKALVYLLFPLLISILLIAGGMTLLNNFATHFSGYIYAKIGAAEWTFWGSEYFGTVLSGVVEFLFQILFFLLMIFYGGYFIIIIMSPVFSMLSERIEGIETGKTYPFSWKKLAKDILRGLAIALRNGLLQLLLSLVILLIGLIPFVGIVAPVLLFIISSYFYGASFLDFAMERHYPSIRQSIAFVSRHRVTAFTNGAFFALSLGIPFCNLFMASFAAIIAVIAATVTIVKIHQHREIQRF